MGFGIQSPADFSFLHDVIRERHPYYIYEDMRRRHPDEPESDHRRGQLLFRVANNLKPSDIRLQGNPSSMMVEYLNAATKGTAPTLLYCEDGVEIPHFHGYSAIILTSIGSANAALWQRLCQSDAVTYDMEDLGIAIFYKDRYPEHYKINKQ